MEHLTASQLLEWEAFDLIEPTLSSKLDVHMAFLRTLMVNLTIGVHAKKGTPLDEVKDHYIKWYQPEAERNVKQDAEQMKNFLMAFAKKHNAKVKEEMDDKKEKR